MFQSVINKLIKIRKKEPKKVSFIAQKIRNLDKKNGKSLFTYLHYKFSIANRIKLLKKSIQLEVRALRELYAYYLQDTKDVEKIVRIIRREKIKKVILRPFQAAVSAVSIPTPFAGSVFVIWFAVDGLYEYTNKTFSRDVHWLKSLVDEDEEEK